MAEEIVKSTDAVTSQESEIIPEQSKKDEKKADISLSAVKISKNTLHDIECEILREQNNNGKFSSFAVGDTIRVHVSIREGNRERVQIYEGVVLCFKHGMNRKTFTVRRISAGIAIERVFPFHSPYIASIEVVRRAKVRRAKLYFLRGRFGKAARLKELLLKKATVKKR